MIENVNGITVTQIKQKKKKNLKNRDHMNVTMMIRLRVWF